MRNRSHPKGDIKDMSTHSTQKGWSRRRFLGSSLAAAAGVSLAGPVRLAGAQAAAERAPLKIKQYRTLGRTGHKVSDISFGSGELKEPALLEAILDAGINYIDSAEGYGRGSVERIIGEVLKKRDRKSVFVTTKLGLREKDTKETLIQRAHKCLERLQADYVDCLMIHMPSTVEKMKNENFHAAVLELKTQGRVRFCGLSNHGPQWMDVPETMEKVLLAAAEDGRFDVMLFVYNFLQRDQGEKILKACREKNIGATLMKTNPVLNYLEVKERMDQAEEEGREVPERQKKLLSRLKERADRAEAFKSKYNLTHYDEIRNAAVKFALSHPDVSTACLTIKNFSDLDAYVSLSGERFTAGERKTLAAYEGLYGSMYCRHACGGCESRCPHEVPVNTIMRYNHYFRAQGREKTAMVKYAAMNRNKPDLCSRCSGYCEQSCPYDVPIQSLLVMAHQTLSLV